MTVITGVRLTNFLCYRGEREVELGPGIFALTADREGDPRRSNAQGKSAFLWALRFALTGDHPRRTEDEWITDGEREGGVDLELSDGTFISRWRTRGEATRLKVLAGIDPAFDDGRPLELHGDEAQKTIERIVGFSKDEQATTWWCKQGEPDAFVNGDPGETTASVVAWCGVEPVRRASKRIAEKLARLLKEDAKDLAVLEQARRDEKEIASELPADIDEWRRPRLENLERLRTLAREDSTAREKERERERIEEEAARHAKLDAERVKLEQVPAAPSPEDIEKATTELEGKRSLYAVASADEQQKRKLAKGEFDGVCPVGGIECPAKQQLNANATRGRELHLESKRMLKMLEDEGAEARKKLDTLRATERAQLDASARLRAIRPEIARLAPSAAAAKLFTPKAEKDDDAPANRYGDAVRAQAEELEKMSAKIELHTTVVRRIGEVHTRRLENEPLITAYREALQILGPSGAQRRLVDGFLGDVEAQANEDMTRAGVDLSVAFEWQRELAKPAEVCATCGQPFPSSTKVKQCEHCGAERGRKIEQKLRCTVTPKSGGMDALAGVAVRLAALAWLKARRDSSWSVVAFDEPFAAVDAHHRMILGRHLVAMLGGHYGVEQAFVSAHDAALLAALPCRIVVHGSERGSSIEVIR